MTRESEYPRFIRASELARWAYCERAWWLQYVRGHTPANREALERGRSFHRAHVRHVDRAALYGRLALLAAAGGGLLLVLALLLWWL